MQTIQPKILDFPRAKLNGKKTSGKKMSKIWVYLVRLPSYGNFGKCCSIHSWKLPKIQTGHFGSPVTLRSDKTSTPSNRAKETKSYKAEITLLRFLHQG